MNNINSVYTYSKIKYLKIYINCNEEDVYIILNTYDGLLLMVSVGFNALKSLYCKYTIAIYFAKKPSEKKYYYHTIAFIFHLARCYNYCSTDFG